MSYPEQCVGKDPCPFVARSKGTRESGRCPDCGQVGQRAEDAVKPEGGAGSEAGADQALDVRPVAEDPRPGSRGFRR